MNQRYLIRITDKINDTMLNQISKYFLKNGNCGLDIDVLIDSPGGCAISSRGIIKLFQTYKKKHPQNKIRAYVYSRALSGAMAIMLCADEFYCSDFTQFGHINVLISFNSHSNFTISNKNVDELSQFQMTNSTLAVAINCFKNEESIHYNFIKDLLNSHPIYSKNITSIMNTLYYPENHFETIDYTTIEKIGCVRNGIIPSYLLPFFDTNKDYPIYIPYCINDGVKE